MLDCRIPAFGTTLGGLGLMTAKVAGETVISTLKGERETAVRATADMAALLA